MGDQPSRQTIQAETAGHLRTLYTIGAGISGAVAMDRIVTYGDDFIQPELVATAVIMLVAFVAIVSIDPLRNFFELIDFTFLDYLIISGVTIVWAAVLRTVWRRRLFERSLRLDEEFHRLTK